MNNKEEIIAAIKNSENMSMVDLIEIEEVLKKQIKLHRIAEEEDFSNYGENELEENY